MSANSEEDKTDGNKTSLPLDLASKITVTKTVEVPKGTPLVMSQSLRGMRVLTQSAVTGAVSGASTGSSIIVPQTIIKQGDGIQRAQIAINPSATQTVTITRPTHITLAAPIVAQTQSSGITSHVPRGPAVVANLATPRSAVASPIRAPGLATTPSTQPASFVTAVRQVTPSRTPSPAGTAIPTAWLSTSGAMQVQPGTVKTVGGSATVLSPTMQRVPITGTPVRGQQVVARAQISQGARPVMHGLAATQIFKPTSGIQSVTIAQVLPNRTQTLVYSTGNTQQFTGNPRLALTGISTNQRPVTLARSNQLMAARLAVPVSVSQGSARITVTSANTIYTSGARITTAQTPVQNTVVGTNVRAAVPLSQPTRLTVTSPGTLLTTAQPRFSVANQPGQPGSTVVIGTQSGRITGSTVSLHPVVVANTSQARTIQTQGPKVINTQQAQGAVQHQVPTVAKIPAQQSTVVPVAVTVQGTPGTVATRTIIASPIVSQRPVTVSTPIVKVIMQNQRTTIDSETPTTVQNATNVFIHTTPVVRRTSPGPANSNITEIQRTPATTSTTYTVPSGATYYYDTSSGYTVAGGNIVQRPFTPSSGSFASVPQNTPVQIRAASIPAQVHGIMSGQPIQFNPVMVVEQKRTQQFVESTQIVQQSPNEHVNPLPSIGKVTSSPRPSILRKRDNEGSPLKAAKNLAPVLANLSAPVSPPSRPESRGNGNHSPGGSTTLSATSSPGLDEVGDNSLPLPSVSIANSFASIAVKLEQEDDRPPQEMSPRKKPRKQQLTGNDLHEPKFNLDDMQFISESKIKREEPEKYISTTVCEEPREQCNRNEVTVKKPAPQLLNSYRQTWKSTHNHYLRYTDVKPKDERRPSIIDLANQSHVTQKINGWKVHHLSTQMEDLVDFESQVYDTLTSMLKLMETKESTGHEKEFNHIYELIKGNMQRSKIINDSMSEAKNSVMKIFDHKEHVADIINRCASKRNFKKRDKF